MSFKTRVLENFKKIHRKTPVPESFCNFIKETLGRNFSGHLFSPLVAVPIFLFVFFSYIYWYQQISDSIFNMYSPRLLHHNPFLTQLLTFLTEEDLVEILPFCGPSWLKIQCCQLRPMSKADT